MNQESSSQSKPMATLIHWLPMAVFAALVILRAVLDPYREDEEYTWWLIREPWDDFIREIIQDVHPPLFYICLRFFIQVFDHPFMMKIFVMFFGMLAFVLAMKIVKQGWGPRAAWMTGWLWATFPFFVHMSQDCRMYSMGLALELLSAWLLVNSDKKPMRNGLVMPFVLAASWYTHNFCAFFSITLYVAFFVLNLSRMLRGQLEKAQWRRSAAWQVATGIGALALYAPWLPVVFNQAGSDFLSNMYHSPGWFSVPDSLFLVPYSLDRFPQWLGFTFSILFMHSLIFIGLLLGKPEPSNSYDKNSRIPVWFWIVIGIVPFAIVFYISMAIIPVLAPRRHTILFLPVLLMGSGIGLAALGKWSRRAICLGSFITVCFVIVRPFDYDPRPAIRKVLSYDPASLPVLLYPSGDPNRELEWQSTNLQPLNEETLIPEDLTEYILVLRMMRPGARNELQNRVNALLSSAESVNPIHTDFFTVVYHVRGMPVQQTRELLIPAPYLGVRSTRERLGSWIPRVEYDVHSFPKIIEPVGAKVALSIINPDWQGIRLAATETYLDFGAEWSDSAAMNAVIVYGRLVQHGAPDRVLWSRNGTPLMNNYWADHTSWWQNQDNIVAGLVDSRNTPPVFTITIPEHLIQPRQVPAGDFIPGVYLTWAAVVPLDPAQMFDGEATFIDIGALGDDLFLRGGQHEREGVTPNFVRWMEPDFSVEVPVFEPGIQRIQISGILPAKIETRTVTVTVPGGGLDGGDPTGQVTIPTGDWNSFNLDLDAPLATGPRILQFEIGGVYIPKAHGDGEDPRELGFLLDQIRLLKRP